MKKRTIPFQWYDDNHISQFKKRLYFTIIGGIIGDALGVPVEFKARNLNITGMTGSGHIISRLEHGQMIHHSLCV